LVSGVWLGLKFTRKQQPRMMNNVGRLCKWEHGELGDRRRDDEFHQLFKFQVRIDRAGSALGKYDRFLLIGIT
jgi:hypothetical protein